MSIYNLIFGCDPRTPLILGMLGLTRDDLGRFMDSIPYQGRYAVIARINDRQKDYQWVFDNMSKHPLFDHMVEDGAEVMFLFNKPSRESYTLPEGFTVHFDSLDAAWSAVEYLNGMRERPRQMSVTG